MTARTPVCLIGERGSVSLLLQEQLRQRTDIELSLFATESILDEVKLPCFPADAIFVLATTDFASARVFQKLPENARVLDISPAFRMHPEWVYGLPELPGNAERIATARRVANPGCFATAAILLLEPVLRAGLLEPHALCYLDAVGGYTTGGHTMVERALAGTLEATAVYGLSRPHRHLEEIQCFAGCNEAALWFTPKIGAHARGIRMQIPFAGVDRQELLSVYQKSYDGHDIVTHHDVPGRIAADVWANKAGAGLWVIPQPRGVLAVCALDNLGKGAVDSAMANLDLMLGRAHPLSLQ